MKPVLAAALMLTALCAAPAASAQADDARPNPKAKVTNSMAQRMQACVVCHGKIPACVTCHGDNMAGRLPAMPGLLTLPSDYLIGELGAWRAGQRKANEPDCMAEVARRLSPEELGAVARWLSAQTLPLGTKPAAASMEPLPIRCGSGEP